VRDGTTSPVGKTAFGCCNFMLASAVRRRTVQGKSGTYGVSPTAKTSRAPATETSLERSQSEPGTRAQPERRVRARRQRPQQPGARPLEAKEARTLPVGVRQQARFRRRRLGGRPQARRCRVQQSTADAAEREHPSIPEQATVEIGGVWITEWRSPANARNNSSRRQRRLLTRARATERWAPAFSAGRWRTAGPAFGRSNAS